MICIPKFLFFFLYFIIGLFFLKKLTQRKPIAASIAIIINGKNCPMTNFQQDLEVVKQQHEQWGSTGDTYLAISSNFRSNNCAKDCLKSLEPKYDLPQVHNDLVAKDE